MPNLLIVSRKQRHKYEFENVVQVSKYLGPYITCQRLHRSGKVSGLRNHTRARFGWDYRIPGYGLNGVLHVR